MNTSMSQVSGSSAWAKNRSRARALFVEARRAWLAVSLVVAPLLVTRLVPSAAPKTVYQVANVGLGCVGVWLVVTGAVALANLVAQQGWGAQSVPEQLSGWLKRVANPPEPQVINASAHMSAGASCVAHGRGVVGTPTLEQRITWLEEDRARDRAELLATRDELGKTRASLVQVQGELSDGMRKMQRVLVTAWSEGVQDVLLGALLGVAGLVYGLLSA